MSRYFIVPVEDEPKFSPTFQTNFYKVEGIEQYFSENSLAKLQELTDDYIRENFSKLVAEKAVAEAYKQGYEAGYKARESSPEFVKSVQVGDLVKRKGVLPVMNTIYEPFVVEEITNGIVFGHGNLHNYYHALSIKDVEVIRRKNGSKNTSN